MKAKNISTDLGDKILETLVKSSGWRIQSQYDLMAFDKGIDFDSYTIEKNGRTLYFEWTNWLEWEINGDSETIHQLARDFGFELVI